MQENEGRVRAPSGKKTKILSAVFMTAIILISFFAGFFVRYFTQKNQVRTISEIIKIIDDAAVKYTEGDYGKSGEDAVRAVVKELLYYDAYAQYFTPAEYDAMNSESKGNYRGFGVSFFSGTGEVYSVTGNSPAERAGIKEGDVIIAGKKAGDDVFTEFSDTFSLLDFLGYATENETVSLKISRGGETLEVSMKKENYQAAYVRYADDGKNLNFRTVDGKLKAEVEDGGMSGLACDTAYISLSAFEGGAAEQFGEAMEFMKSRGKTKLIFDLRRNGGGYMDVLTDLAPYLIKQDGKKVLTYVKEKNSTDEYKIKSGKYNNDIKGICVLADSGTASASECLLGAMLYYGGTEGGNGFSMSDVIIPLNSARGDYSTYGKGIMQTTYRLSTGGAFKLTTAKIVWPDGETCIQDKGVCQTLSENCVAREDMLARAAEILAAKD